LFLQPEKYQEIKSSLNIKTEFMKLKILILFTIILFLPHFLNAQNLKINQTFKADTLLNIFNNEIIGSIKISAKVLLNNENSLIRVILVDSNSSEWLIYETYSQIIENNPSTIIDEADETEFLNHIHPKYIEIQIIDASLSINSLKLGTPLNKDERMIENDQKIKKQLMNNQKIDQLNKFIERNGKKWIAGETWISSLSYEKKKELFGKEKFNSKGLEFYIGGIWEINENETAPKLKSGYTSCFIDHFDWREKHGANQLNSQYYDGDISGGGWLTPVKTQRCNNCWAYAAVGETEVVANLYFNRHLDFNLSETELTFCYGLGNDCEGGWISNGLKYIKNNGVVSESCFPTPLDNFQHLCSEKCATPSEQLRISGYTRNNVSEDDSLKKLIIKSPVTAAIDCAALRHGMVLCGYHKINANDSLYYVSNGLSGWIKIPPGDPLIGKTYWIFKNSWGQNSGYNGYYYIVFQDLSVLSSATQICAAKTPVTSLIYSNNYIRCVDLDNDGYFNWGIGSKPSTCPTCPNEEDGDDSNSNLGPINDYGYCTHLVRTNQTWQSLYNENGGVIVRNGGNLTLNGATINLGCDSSFSVELGGVLTFNNGTVQ
jgi:hypothetical protein